MAVKWKTFLYRIFILVIILLAAFIAAKSLFPQKEVIIETNTVTKYRVITKTVYLDSPKVRFLEIPLPGDTVEIPSNIDELTDLYKRVWKELYTRKFYRDTLQLDSLGNIIFTGESFANNLENLRLENNIIIPHTYTKEVVTRVNMFYAGIEVGPQNFSTILEYSRKGSYNYFVRYNTVQQTIHGGILINLNRLW